MYLRLNVLSLTTVYCLYACFSSQICCCTYLDIKHSAVGDHLKNIVFVNVNTEMEKKCTKILIIV